MKFTEGGKFFFHFFEFFLNSREQQLSRLLPQSVAGSIGFHVRCLEKNSAFFEPAETRFLKPFFE